MTSKAEPLEEVLEPALAICDAHIHIVNAHGFNYQLEDHLRDAGAGHRVVSSLYVETSDHYRTTGPEHLRSAGETEFASELNKRTRGAAPRVAQAIVSYVDLAQGRLTAEALDAHIAAGDGALRGVRADQTWDDTGSLWVTRRDLGPDFFSRPDFRAGVGELARRGLALDTWQYYYQLASVGDLARAFPDTQIIVDHVGGIAGVGAYAGRQDEIFNVWRGHIRELARLPNVWMKLGGFGMTITGFDFHQRSTPASSEEIAAAWRPYFEACIEAFGPGRCMFESNFPVDFPSFSYRVLWNAFKRITSGASADEKAMLFHDNAMRCYRLGTAD